MALKKFTEEDFEEHEILIKKYLKGAKSVSYPDRAIVELLAIQAMHLSNIMRILIADREKT